MIGTGDPDLDSPAGRGQLRRPGRLGAPLGQLGVGEGTQHAQEVGDPLDVLDPPVLGEPLQLPLQLGEDLGVEQFAQLRPAEQLGEQMGVQGEGGGAPFGERRVALVQELGHVTEEERAGEGRGLLGGHLDQPDPARFQVAHQFREPGDVEHVLEAFTDGLQNDRERAELRGDLEQLGGSLALLPERGALARGAPGQQQGTRGALPEPGGEQGRSAHLVGDDLLDLALVEDDVGGRHRGWSLSYATAPGAGPPFPASGAPGASKSSRSSPIMSASGSRSTIPSSACMTWASNP